MINGAHTILYSTDAEADRAFLRDVLGFDHVDAGDGWLIFALPPAEVAVHPAEKSGAAELYFMCDDINGFIAEMKSKDVPCAPMHSERWGHVTSITLPGGGAVGVYEPLHARPEQNKSKTTMRASS